MENEDYKKQIDCLNERINRKLEKASALRRKGCLQEWAAMEEEVDRDIDALVDLKEQACQSGKEVLV